MNRTALQKTAELGRAVYRYNTTAKTVKNIKSITQLPLTGAAGTTLFTVVALLVAGAGVTIAIKSRQNAEA